MDPQTCVRRTKKTLFLVSFDYRSVNFCLKLCVDRCVRGAADLNLTASGQLRDNTGFSWKCSEVYKWGWDLQSKCPSILCESCLCCKVNECSESVVQSPLSSPCIANTLKQIHECVWDTKIQDQDQCLQHFQASWHIAAPQKGIANVRTSIQDIISSIKLP